MFATSSWAWISGWGIWVLQADHAVACVAEDVSAVFRHQSTTTSLGPAGWTSAYLQRQEILQCLLTCIDAQCGYSLYVIISNPSLKVQAGRLKGLLAARALGYLCEALWSKKLAYIIQNDLNRPQFVCLSVTFKVSGNKELCDEESVWKRVRWKLHKFDLNLFCLSFEFEVFVVLNHPQPSHFEYLQFCWGCMVQHIQHIQELQTALSESLKQLPEKAYKVAGPEELGLVEGQILGRLALNLNCMTFPEFHACF